MSLHLLLALDLAIVAAAALSSLLWLRASRGRLRRVSRAEVLDHADYNRLVCAINRAQIRNSHAALATGVVAALAGARLLLAVAS
ncbi:hypothetical protein EYB45_00165 [Erythrobacteraceae bacterium CFH 75059]|uniref:hypothetical protein n=1 Tax=Qipengyuania thermophila TaxID=2509361 RepID=UPI0010220665|nr:hypothetical protein [Qipengyuania thermophila]TCD06200.1 hypothetical protein EYB45_00165 [Erythrobacteraceae bacterium CFH 75059]